MQVKQLKVLSTVLNGGSEHLTKAGALAQKAHVAQESGKGGIAALHLANARRAFDAGVRDTLAGAKLVDGQGWDGPMGPIRNKIDSVHQGVRNIEIAAFKGGDVQLFQAANEGRKLQDAAAIAHGYAVIP